MLCDFIANYLIEFFFSSHDLFKSNWDDLSFLSWPLSSAGRSAATQPGRDGGWSLTYSKLFVVSCRCSPLSELTWTSPPSFASLSATCAQTNCSKVPTVTMHTHSTHKYPTPPRPKCVKIIKTGLIFVQMKLTICVMINQQLRTFIVHHKQNISKLNSNIFKYIQIMQTERW